MLKIFCYRFFTLAVLFPQICCFLIKVYIRSYFCIVHILLCGNLENRKQNQSGIIFAYFSTFFFLQKIWVNMMAVPVDGVLSLTNQKWKIEKKLDKFLE